MQTYAHANKTTFNGGSNYCAGLAQIEMKSEQIM